MRAVNGIELIGTEVEPDWRIHAGNFQYGPTIADRISLQSSNVVAATSQELARATQTAPDPDKRYHYRYTAAKLRHRWENSDDRPTRWGFGFICKELYNYSAPQELLLKKKTPGRLATGRFDREQAGQASQPRRFLRETNCEASGTLVDFIPGPSHSTRRPSPTRSATTPNKIISVRYAAMSKFE